MSYSNRNGGHGPILGNDGNDDFTFECVGICAFINRFRRSADWVPIESAGIASSCPNMSRNVIYHRTTGVIPNYAGHVPGEIFSIGATYGNSTVDAKRWLALNKEAE